MKLAALVLKGFETWEDRAVHQDQLSPGAFTEVTMQVPADAAGVGAWAVSMWFFPLARFWFLQVFLFVTQGYPLLSPSLKEDLCIFFKDWVLHSPVALEFHPF